MDDGFAKKGREKRGSGNGAERRAHERVLLSLEVDYRSSENFLFAYITDISEMGIFIQTRAPEPRGTALNLRFRIPDGPELNLDGCVIWTNPYKPGAGVGHNPGMGVRFEGLTGHQREVILKLVKTFAYLNGNPEPNLGHS